MFLLTIMLTIFNDDVLKIDIYITWITWMWLCLLVCLITILRTGLWQRFPVKKIRQIPMFSKPQNHSIMNNGFIGNYPSDDQNEDQIGAIEKLALYRQEIKIQMMSKPHNGSLLNYGFIEDQDDHATLVSFAGPVIQNTRLKIRE